MNERTLAPSDGVFDRLYRERRPELSRSLRRVVDYIAQHRVQVLAQSAVEIGQMTTTSDSTVIRAVQALGFKGLPELRHALTRHLTGADTPEADLRHSLDEVGADVEAAMRSVRDEMLRAITLLGAPETMARLTDALRVLDSSDRIAVFGIGPTAHLAAYLSTRLRRQGRARLLIGQTGHGLADELLELKAGDAIVMMAYGEIYGEARATIAVAAELGIPIVLISDTSDTALRAAAEVVVPVMRGRTSHFSLHGGTLTCLEMLLLGLAVGTSPEALASLARLSVLRDAVGG